MKHQFFSAVALALSTFMSLSAYAAPPTDDYSAPFGVVGTASTTNPPPFTTTPPPPDTVNWVDNCPSGEELCYDQICRPTGTCPPAPGPATPPGGAPTPPTPVDSASEMYKASFKLCQEMIPGVRDGFYEYISNDPENVDGTSVHFLVPGTVAVNAAVLKKCLKDGYRPPENAGHTCTSCTNIVTSMPNGFYSATPPLTTYDPMSGFPIYDFSSTGPTWVRNCLMIGHLPPELGSGFTPIGTVYTDPYGGSFVYSGVCTDVPVAPVPPNYCPPTDNISWNNSPDTPTYNCIGGVGSGVNGTSKIAYSAAPGVDGQIHVKCDVGNLGNGSNGWVIDTAMSASKKCGPVEHKKDDCKPGDYTVRYTQTFSPGGQTITNCCTANFPTGQDGDVYSQSFAHTYAEPPIDSFTSGSGTFVCVAGNSTNGIGGWVPTDNFKCLRPTYTGGACTGGASVASYGPDPTVPPTTPPDCAAGVTLNWYDTASALNCYGKSIPGSYGDSAVVTPSAVSQSGSATFECLNNGIGWTLDTTKPITCGGDTRPVNTNCAGGATLSWTWTDPVTATTHMCTGEITTTEPYMYTDDVRTASADPAGTTKGVAQYKCMAGGWVLQPGQGKICEPK